jgi:uncharacterized protein (DUF1697 family)
MADLRRVAEGCGYEDVRTYVQSGNLVFSTSSRGTKAVADRLRAAIAEATDVRPDVVVRTAGQLQQVIDDDPYADRDPGPTQLHVVFLPDGAEASLGGIDLASFAPEHATAQGQHVYLYAPDGVGRSKLAAALTRGAGATGTMRNWRTVTKLAEMAAATS